MTRLLITAWDFFEAILGLLAVFMLVLTPAVVSTLVLVVSLLSREWKLVGISLPIFSITVPMACWLIKMSDAAIREFRVRFDESGKRRFAFAIFLIVQLPLVPKFARFAIGFWWIAHFLTCSMIVKFFCLQVIWANWGMSAALAIAYFVHFAGNVFLILSVAICFNSPLITAHVWRWRAIVDAALVIFLTLI